MKLFILIVVLLIFAAVNAARVEHVEHAAHALCDEIAIFFNDQFDMMYDPEPAGPHFFIAHSAISAPLMSQLEKLSSPAYRIQIERVSKPVTGLKVYVTCNLETHFLRFTRSSLFAQKHILQVYFYRKQSIASLAELMQYPMNV